MKSLLLILFGFLVLSCADFKQKAGLKSGSKSVGYNAIYKVPFQSNMNYPSAINLETTADGDMRALYYLVPFELTGESQWVRMDYIGSAGNSIRFANSNGWGEASCRDPEALSCDIRMVPERVDRNVAELSRGLDQKYRPFERFRVRNDAIGFGSDPVGEIFMMDHPDQGYKQIVRDEIPYLECKHTDRQGDPNQEFGYAEWFKQICIFAEQEPSYGDAIVQNREEDTP